MPHEALTMGIATILEAREIAILATGDLTTLVGAPEQDREPRRDIRRVAVVADQRDLHGAGLIAAFALVTGVTELAVAIGEPARDELYECRGGIGGAVQHPQRHRPAAQPDRTPG